MDQLVKNLSILAVAIVQVGMPCLTMPFQFEGKKKLAIADTVQAMVMESCPNALIVAQQPLLKEYPEARFKDALDVALFEIERHIEMILSGIGGDTLNRDVSLNAV